MAITRIGTFATGSSSGAGGGTITTSAFNLAAGNLVVVTQRGTGPATGVPTDTAGNTYTLISSRTDDVAFIGRFYMWYAYNTASNASNVVSLNVSSLDFGTINAVQYSGAATATNPLDTFTSETQASNSTGFTSTTFNTSATTGLIVAAATRNTAAITYTAGSGFTMINSPTDSSIEENLTGTQSLVGTTASMSTSSSAHWYFITACFKTPAVSANSGFFFAAAS